MPEISEPQEIGSGNPFIDAVFDVGERLAKVQSPEHGDLESRAVTAYFRLAKAALSRIEYLLMYGALDLAEEQTVNEYLKYFTEDDFCFNVDAPEPPEAKRLYEVIKAQALDHTERIEQIIEQL